MRFIKKIFKWLFIVLLLLNVFILVTGRFYLYKGIGNTYLKGRSGPAIDEYKIFYNREIKAGTGKEWAKSKAYNKVPLSTETQALHQKLGSIAYLVIVNDSVLHEEYWDGFNENSITNSFSMAKTFVSVLTGIAIGEGKIKSEDEPVGNYLPEFKEGDKSKVTIRHLLTMSSGIDFDEHYANPLAYPAQAYYGPDLKKLTLKYNVVKEPGKGFSYLSGNTALLSFVLEKATGMTLSDYASEKLWKPIGAKNNAYWSLDHEGGVEKAYCCFNSNARDFARIGKLYLDSGRVDGQQLIPQHFVLESVKPALLWDEDEMLQNTRYGYSWWLLPDYKGHNIYYARGILGQYVIMIPDKKMIVVRLGHKRENIYEKGHPVDVYKYVDEALSLVRSN